VTILDVNLLLHAYDANAPQQTRAEHWLTELLSGSEQIGLAWVTIWAFIRISTSSRILTRPLEPKKAFEVIAQWVAQPGVVVVQPGPRHAELLERLVLEYGAAGPLVTDAVLAALAIEHGAVLASTDQDFRRFPELRWVNPLA
jgi:toxin-antitoxin system PIN domain toxin